MNELPLEINETVEVMLVEDGATTNCTSRVYDRTEGHIQLNWPTRSGIRIPLRKDQELSLVFFRNDGIYASKGLVDALENEPIPTVFFRALGDVERIQRRDYCRVRASLPVLMVEAISLRAASEGKSKGLNITTETIDISGSGMCIHKEYAIPPGAVFETRLTLEPGQPPIDLMARVVYSDRIPTLNGRDLFRVGIEFMGVPDSKRRLIVRQVFKLQQMALAGNDLAK